MTKISVVTAVFNSASTIADAIESVLSQTHPHIETTVIDGGSTDGTLEILKKYTDRLSTLISEPDRGLYDALNKGIRHSSGDVIGFLHADDLLADETVLSLISDAFSDPEIDAVFGDLIYVKDTDPSSTVRYWRAGKFTDTKLAYGWMPPHPSLYIRRKLYEKFGDFDITFKIAADYDFVLRLFSGNKIRSVYIPKVFVRMRTGGISNRSLPSILLKSREDLKALRRNNVGGFMALGWKNLSKISQFL